ncbi:hypothetical protein HDU87_002217 [Geranomyces variabilis]|uniref:Uncharacterized protein n=1 Tax=Geranomyces variabilis TaxID=109894 RepID=A0AAD5TGE5_9FUNG|nr:hypothetical protein HDU87_002217 [Geranomyces variabilis]
MSTAIWNQEFDQLVRAHPLLSWHQLTARFCEELDALPEPDNRLEKEKRLAAKLYHFGSCKKRFLEAQSGFHKILDIHSVQSDTTNVQAHTLNQLLGDAGNLKRPRTPTDHGVAAQGSPTTPPQVQQHRPTLGVSDYPGAEGLVSHIRSLHQAKKQDFIQLGCLFWGILDTDDKESLALLSNKLVTKIQRRVETTVTVARSDAMRHLLDIDKWQNLQSVSLVVDSLVSGGLTQLWREVGGDPVVSQSICKDQDARYIMASFLAMNRYIDNYAGRRLRNERTLDVHAVAPFAQLPFKHNGPTLYYGEIMSVADQAEKHDRCNDDQKKGKFCDFLYQISETESGVGENSGPFSRKHEAHPKENLTHLSKTAKSQLLALSVIAPLSDDLVVPFFHVFNLQVDFYVQFQFAPGLFARHKFWQVAFPQSDNDVQSVLELSHAFLAFRDIMEATACAASKGRARSGPRLMTGAPGPGLTHGVHTPKRVKTNAKENNE